MSGPGTTTHASEDLFEQIRKLGYELTPEQIQASMALFAPLAPVPGPDVTVHRDLFYGPDPRHRLDIFVPAAGAAEAMPAVVFVHGGGFVRGDKGAPDAPFYNNVGLWAARSGCVGVTMTYRLAPAAAWPAGSEDVGAAVRFLRASVQQYGGDPNRIFLMGQSAGAVHEAGYAAGNEAASMNTAIAGSIIVSVIYEISSADRNPIQAANYGEDPARFAEQSTLMKLSEDPVPCFYTVSEFDPTDFQRLSAWVVEAHAARQGRWPRLMQLAGHNHLTGVLQIGSPVDTLGPKLLRFIGSFSTS